MNIANVKVLQYADDTKIMIKVSGPEAPFELQQAINKLAEWSTINKIPLNKDKTQMMTIDTRTNTIRRQYIIDGSVIEHHQVIKDLGVTFDSKLNFVPHTDIAMLTARKMIGAAKRFAFKINNPQFLINIFRIYILPKIEFGHLLWATTKTRCERLESLQRGLTSYTLRSNAQHNTLNYQERLVFFDLNSIAERLESQRAITAIKILRGVFQTQYKEVMDSRARRTTNGARVADTFFDTRHIHGSDPLIHLLAAVNEIGTYINFMRIPILRTKTLIKEHHLEGRSDT